MKKIHIQIRSIQGGSVCRIWHLKIHGYEFVPDPDPRSLSVRPNMFWTRLALAF